MSAFSLIGEERASLATGGNRGCYTAKLLCDFRICNLNRPVLFVVQEGRFYVYLLRNTVDVLSTFRLL